MGRMKNAKEGAAHKIGMTVDVKKVRALEKCARHYGGTSSQAEYFYTKSDRVAFLNICWHFGSQARER